MADISKSELCTFDPNLSLDNLVGLYDNVLKRVFDDHAPLKRAIVRVRDDSKWYTELIRSQKQKRRQFERLWRKTKLEIHRQMFLQQKSTLNHLLIFLKKNIIQVSSLIVKGIAKNCLMLSLD